MKSITLYVNRFVFIGAILLLAVMKLLSAQVILQPVEDVYIVTFGGGEGCNIFLKYDISPVPSGATIDSVALIPFVWQINPNWNGNVVFWNVNNQTWTESDSARLIWDSPTSDSIHQVSGFGSELGYTRSVDLTDIFLTDFLVGNTYCTIKLKDPDDPTTTPMPGSYPFDSDDTLTLGERTGGNHAIFYPHEFTNAPPWLIIAYHEVGIEEAKMNETRPLLHTYPNPFTEKTDIRYQTGAHVSSIHIYDVTGRPIKRFNLQSEIFDLALHSGAGCNLQSSVAWDGRDESGRRVQSGVYFCELRTGRQKVMRKICLVR